MLSNKDILQEIVMNAEGGIIIADNNGKILSCNNGLLELLNYQSVHQLLEKNVNQLIAVNSEEPLQTIGFYQESFGTKAAQTTMLDRDDTAINILLKVSIIKNENSNEFLYAFYITDLSQLINLQQQQNNNNKELNSLTANIPSVVFRCQYQRRRNIQFISPTIAKLSGWEVEDFYADKVKYTDLMLENDEQRIWHKIGEALHKQQSYNVEYRLLHRSGKSIWVSENGRIVFDDDGIPMWIVGSISNNTDIKMRNAEFEGTVKALNRATAVIEFDLTGCVLQANDIFLELMGYTRDEVIGHHHSIFCTDEQANSKEYRTFWQKLRLGEFDNGEYLRVNKQGEEVWIQATYNPIFDADGKPYKVMKFATDLSQRREMETELRNAIELAESAVSARGSFLANMSHEIRTPMNAIIGFTELLLKTELDNTQQKHANTVLKSSRSLLRLLNEILDVSKLEQGAVELEIRDFNCLELFEQIFASLKVSADKKNLPLQLDIDESVPQFIHGDSLRIQQVLLNLLSNAIKFTETGHVTLFSRYENEHLIFKVIDTGIGMDQQYLKKIFDPFTQSDASTTRKFGGTGLGTAICKQLVELMQGTIDVSSEVGKGSTFTITLPLKAGQNIEQQEIETIELQPIRILVAEDTEASLELLTIVLEGEGHELVCTRNGEELFETYKLSVGNNASIAPFDIVITDLQMPKMDGFEACKHIRQYEKHLGIHNVPVIALSANVLEQDRQTAKAVGMDGFSFKPLQVDKLFAEMDRVLKLDRTSNELIDNVKVDSQTADTATIENKKTAIEKQLAELTDIDWQNGLRLWKKKSVYIKAIERFTAEHNNVFNELSTALQQQDYNIVSSLAHRLSGVAGNLRLNKVHFICSNIEAACHEKNYSDIPQYLDFLPDYLEQVSTEIVQLQKDEASTTSEKKSNTESMIKLSEREKHQVLQDLNTLKTSLEGSELNGRALNNLQFFLNQYNQNRLTTCIDEFEFDNAINEINILIKLINHEASPKLSETY